MIVNAAIFTCSICGEPSTQICAYCTKDACGGHRCVRCKRCSDCCECESPLSAEEPATPDAVASPRPSRSPSLPPNRWPSCSKPRPRQPRSPSPRANQVRTLFLPQRNPVSLRKKSLSHPILTSSTK